GNTGFALNLSTAGGELIDSIELGAAVPGASFNLNPFLQDPFINDDPTSWCLATAPYGLGDLGSPGYVNSQCN
ncbi:MAG TPA: hypothetical protein VFX50_16440, partial [Gemmatimonadales bacterium]|nr:hypothetical protein [Gemmatimonadales bacterium]